MLSMLLFGGATLHYFAVALTIGMVLGIYSAVLVMAPLTKWLGISREDLVKPIKKPRADGQEGDFEEGDFENEFEGNIKPAKASKGAKGEQVSFKTTL